MARTRINGEQVEDGTIKRADLDVTTAGAAVIRKVLPGTLLTLSSTGPDAGTGDVTLNVSIHVGTSAPSNTSFLWVDTN
jgi:hypothetical protein